MLLERQVLYLSSLILLTLTNLLLCHLLLFSARSSGDNYYFSLDSESFRGLNSGFPTILFPLNGSIVEYSPVPIIVLPSSSSSTLVELKSNSGSWEGLLRNEDEWLIAKNLSLWRWDFWYSWLPVKSRDDQYLIEFRENGSHPWSTQLIFNVSLPLIPPLEDAKMVYNFQEGGLWQEQKSYTYTFNGRTGVFFVKKENLLSKTEPVTQGERVLNSTEKKALMEIFRELWVTKPHLEDIGIEEQCCDEYYEFWNITISVGESIKRFRYFEHFQPPGFQNIVQHLENLANSIRTTPSSAPIGLNFQMLIVAMPVALILRQITAKHTPLKRR